MSATRGDVRHPNVDGVGILLPSSWWTIDLRDSASRRRSVAKLVEQQVGRDDAHASVRAQLRARLMTAADDTAAAGGRLMAVSLMRAGDVSVPATVAVYRLPSVAPAGDDDAVTELDTLLRATAGPDDHLERADGPGGPVLRRVGRRMCPADLDTEHLPTLLVDYWLDPHDGQGLIYVVFSSPLVDARDALLELFDVIVASVGSADGAS